MSRDSGPNPLRILVLTQMYPPHHLGGYELLCRDVVELWRGRGHTVEVLTTDYRRPRIKESAEIVTVRRDLRFYWDDYRIVTPSIPVRLQIERGNQKALARALSELRPDVVSVWHMGAMSFALLQTIADHGIPMVFVVGDDWLVYGPAVDAWTKLFSARQRLGRLAHALTGVPTSFRPDPNRFAVCFASEFLRGRALDHSSIALAHTAVVPHGIDPATFAPTQTSSQRTWTWRLLYVGRVEERKGVHVAVEALEHLPEAHLDIVGAPDEGYREQLRQTATRLGVGDRVTFAGSVDRDDLAVRYRSADVLLFPVLWDEPFGLVPLEAMACETPVIATGTGGSGEYLVDGENCLLAPRGDPVALAKAVRKLADDPALRASIIRSGTATVSALGVERLAISLEAWNRAAVDGFRGPPITEGVPASATELDPDA